MVTQTASRPAVSPSTRLGAPRAAVSAAEASPSRLPSPPARSLPGALPPGPYGTHPGPWLAAHRGGMGIAPENTMLAFERALSYGLRYLETDVRVTADGVPLAFHDRTLDRVTGLTGPVAERTWGEITRTRVHGTEPVLPLEELLGALPEACVTIDVEEARAVRPLIEAVRRTGSARRVCVAGGWDGWLAAIREACPGLTTALGWRSLLALVTAARAGVRPSRAVATGAFAHVPMSYGSLAVLRAPRVTERLVEMAGDLGLGVVGWTVNDVPAAARLLDAGVTGVITDRPDLLSTLTR